MFCSQCGRQADDDARFCSGCGAALNAAGASPVESSPAQFAAEAVDTSRPVMVLRPQFVGWPFLLGLLPIMLFLTVWGAVFFGGFGMAIIKATGLPVPVWLPFVFFGLVMGLGVPAIAYTARKRTYEKTEYKLYPDRLEYAEGFWTVEDKAIRWDRIQEASMRRGVVQKRYDLGTIYLTTATGGGPQNRGGGIRLSDVERPEEVYETVQRLVNGG